MVLHRLPFLLTPHNKMDDDPPPSGEDEATTKAVLSPEEQEFERRTQALRNDESCQGPIGLSLRSALHSIMTTTNTSNETEEQQPLFTSEQQDRIMHAFGSAMAASAPMSDNGITAVGVVPPPPAAVAATLTGRLAYANRYGDKWRMVVDQVVLTPQQEKQPSSSSTTTAASTAANSVVVASSGGPSLAIPRLEILAFNDFE